ncbi:HAD-IC family P-type ATPase [Phenylobacterium sp.]|uniref:HAD-IC family P-type ATPase n=1 Tax=Phenylobacterium sp. TaxID=1871053 RepID=UPI0035B208E7
MSTADAHPGLSQAEAERRLAAVGPNELPRPVARSVPRIVLETLREPMFLLLLGAAGLYLALGDLSEGLFLTAGAAVAIGLVILQEARSERALSALRELAQPLARVIRDGAEQRLPARELVPGDLLLVGEGERLPADALLVAGDVLRVDESALTGESAPVAKRLALAEEGGGDPAPGEALSPHLFAGTLVVAGQGVAEVRRTGAGSAIGRIGRSLADIPSEPTPLQRTAGRLAGILGVLALVFCAGVAVAYGLVRSDWIDGALAGITFAIALIPEEFPMVLAVFLALGAWRLATRQVLVRRSAVIETLGAATVLCVDKTGTLTENRMEVARLWTRVGESDPRAGPPAADALALLDLAALASAVRPTDPMDRAVRRLAQGRPGEPERTWPLTAGRMAVIQVWGEAGGARLAAAKGAPEAIFTLCRLDPNETEALQAAVSRLAVEGLRVLAVASARTQGGFPDEPAQADFAFAGLVGFLDPLRPEAAAALAEARGAGIRVVMITGDHPATALAIARAAGLDVGAGVLTGAEVAAMPLDALARRLAHAQVFARVVPEQKLRIVEALKADGEVVAMTGDGVNDAPALEAAHIGIAMGRKGTDVAREAADLVLLDDSFPAIVGGVRMGRRIFANLRRALTYITAIHVPIAGLALAPILLGLPPMLFPMHVVLLELAVDPTCALVFEAARSDARAMRRPPRPRDEPLFGPAQVGVALIQGLGVLTGVLAVYMLALQDHPEAQARGAAFLALVLGNLVLALADSSGGGRLFSRDRVAYWLIAAAVLAVLAAVLALPALAAVFRVALPSADLLALAVAAALAAGGWPAVVNRLRLARAR